MAQFPAKLAPLFKPARWKVLYGGRYSGKSWGVARALILLSLQKPLRILCAREQQNSIGESVHQLLTEQIAALGLEDKFTILKTEISNSVGSKFFFEGVRANVHRIKSYEGIDICWMEEAHLTTRQSWNIIIPTIRKHGSEIWVTFNPDLETDYTYQFLVKKPPASAVVIPMNWRDLDREWLSDAIVSEIDDLKQRDYDAYLNVYEGHCRVILEGAVYANELRDARAQGRICKVPYDPMGPGVDIFFDLGWSDATAIWLRQKVGFEYHYIDYYENRQRPLSHYIQWLQGRGYIYATLWLPHDAKAKELGSGASIEEQFRRSGAFGSIRTLKRLEVEDGINSAREIFPISYFDEERCEVGLRALSNYRYGLEQVGQFFSKRPLHDWTSHGADAFRYSALAIREPRTEALARKRRALEERQMAETEEDLANGMDFTSNVVNFVHGRELRRRKVHLALTGTGTEWMA